MYIRTLIYVFGLLFLTHSSLFSREEIPLAIGGVLDLRDYNFKTEGPISLEGEFEFYWNQMLNPAVENDSGVVSYIQVPGSWYHLVGESHDYSSYNPTVAVSKIGYLNE